MWIKFTHRVDFWKHFINYIKYVNDLLKNKYLTRFYLADKEVWKLYLKY